MAENLVEDLEYIPWYLDESNEPICPSFWEEFECDREICPFSHEIGKFQTSIVLSDDLSSDIQALYKHVKAYILSHPLKEEITNVAMNQNLEDEKDIVKIDQLINEMADFERGPEAADNSALCPFITETGNCLIRGLCEYAHSLNDDKFMEEERQNEWYPASMNCECCKGYLYGCGNENCKKSGKCLVCVN